MNERLADTDDNIRWWRENSPKMDYDTFAKASTLRRVFRGLDAEGAIGNRVVDVGCGPLPVSSLLLEKKKDRKIVNIDVMDFGDDLRGNRYLRYEIGNIGNLKAHSTQKTLIKAARHFDIDPRSTQELGQVDTMIFSELLNYVDFKDVLTHAAMYLKTGGRFIILNKPNRHPRNHPELLHQKGVSSNAELLECLEKDFEIEHKLFPLKREEGPDDARSKGDATMLLVVRKK